MKELDKTLEIINTLRQKCPVDVVRDEDNLITCLKEELGDWRPFVYHFIFS
jgi:hypothetical protein